MGVGTVDLESMLWGSVQEDFRKAFGVPARLTDTALSEVKLVLMACGPFGDRDELERFVKWMFQQKRLIVTRKE